MKTSKWLSKWFGNKEFYTMVLAVFLPIMLQKGVTNFVGLLDNVMVGQVGTEQMSGVSIANQLLSIFNLCIFGGISGIGIFGAQYFGQNNDEGVRRTVRMKYWLCIILLVLFFGIFLTFGRDLIRLFLTDGGDGVGDLEATLEYSYTYLKIMLVGLIPFSVVQIYSSTLSEAKVTLIPMIASSVAVFVNLFFNYCFIFGNLGFPELGCAGAAIATVISRVAECLILLVFALTHRDRLTFQYGLYRTMKVPAALTKRICITAFPLLINEALWSVGQTVIAQCFSRRGLAAVAAFNISNTVCNLFFIFFFSAGNSIGIIVGQLLGAGKIEEARSTDRKLLVFSVLGSVVMALLLAAFSGVIPKIYNTQDVVRNIATDLMRVVAVVMPLNALNHGCYFTIRCGGKTWLTFMFDCCFTWVVSIPTAWLLVHFTDLSVVWVYLAVQLADLIKAAIGVVIVRGGKWANNLVNNDAVATEKGGGTDGI